MAIGEQVVNDIPPKDRDIAMVFQSYALYPHMTVYDNMAFGLKLRKTPKAEIDRRVKEAADILGLTVLLDRKPKALSGGQRQRVALGRAIVREPKVFLLDEPLSNLDAKLRVQARREIAQLHQQLGNTFIYVTHDQTEAMTLADQIALMEDGRMVQCNEPRALYNEPEEVFGGWFLGNPGMNFIDAHCDQTNGKNALISTYLRSPLSIEADELARKMTIGTWACVFIRPGIASISLASITSWALPAASGSPRPVPCPPPAA